MAAPSAHECTDHPEFPPLGQWLGNLNTVFGTNSRNDSWAGVEYEAHFWWEFHRSHHWQWLTVRADSAERPARSSQQFFNGEPVTWY
ncbi:MAG: hypothetical protein CMJ47_04275 [Planctomyces sp.]|nr:hypothetical protein [Planctomyces sp.]